MDNLQTMYTRGYWIAAILAVCAIFGIVQNWLPAAFLITALVLHWQHNSKSKKADDLKE